jgi:hypothetical protein
MNTKIVLAFICAMCSSPIFSQTTSSTSQEDSLSQVLFTRIEKLIAPIPLKIIFWCDSVPSSFQMLGKISFVDKFSGFREDAKGNSRMGFTKSKFSDFNIFFYAKISEKVEIFTIKPNMTLVDFSYLDEIPNKELSPTIILTLKTLSEKNVVRYDEIIFHSTNEHFKYIDNKWIKVE